jgi:hypothetical protein
MMEAARSSKTLVNFYQTTRRYNPEDSHIRTNRRENLKSYFHEYFVTKKAKLPLCQNTRIEGVYRIRKYNAKHYRTYIRMESE